MMKGHAALKQAGREAGVGGVGGADISLAANHGRNVP